jgi:hypothetical protein
MVIETDLSYNSGSFIVKKYAIDDVLTARTNWEQWTDAIYKIENTSYSKNSRRYLIAELARLNSMILFV